MSFILFDMKNDVILQSYLLRLVLKKLKIILNIFIWSVVGLYLTIVILLHLSVIQSKCGQYVGNLLSHKFGTEVRVDCVNLGFLNRIIVDGINMRDQQGKDMLHASRLSVKLDFLALSQGNISITSAQLFGLNAQLYQKNKQSKSNFQFVLDSLASKDSTKQSASIKIHSIVLRNGSVAFDRWDMPTTKKLSLNHLKITGLSSHIIFNEISKDSLNINVKNLSFHEKSGLTIKAFSAKFISSSNEAQLVSFHLDLPHSKITINNGIARYLIKNNKLQKKTLSFSGQIDNSFIKFSDLSFLDPHLEKFSTSLTIQSSFIGSSSSIELKSLKLQADKELELIGKGKISNFLSTPQWQANISHLKVYQAAVKHYILPPNSTSPLSRTGNIEYVGKAAGKGENINIDGVVHTEDGQIQLTVSKNNDNYKGNISTSDFDIARFLGQKKLGKFAAQVELSYQKTTNRGHSFVVKGTIPFFAYNNYSYKNIQLNGSGILNSSFKLAQLKGLAAVDDPNGSLKIQGELAKSKGQYIADIVTEVHRVNLSLLNLSHQWNNRIISFDAHSKISGKQLNSAVGKIELQNLLINDPMGDYGLSNLQVLAGFDKKNEHFVSLNTDFGKALVVGQFDYTSLVQVIKNVILDKLPSVQNLISIHKEGPHSTNFRLYAELKNSDWANFFLNIPFSLQQPLLLSGSVSGIDNQLNINVQAPEFTYQGNQFKDTYIHLLTPNDTLVLDAQTRRYSQHNDKWFLNVKGKAAHDELQSSLSFSDLNSQPLSGTINTLTTFYKRGNGEGAAHIVVKPSQIVVKDSTWVIDPSDVEYSKKYLSVNHFNIHHDDQHVNVSGIASMNPTDSLVADLKNIDVGYVLNLLNFHAVEFDGLLSGQAHLSGLFGKIHGHADVSVNHFLFQTGRMGVLDANVRWNENLNQIDIKAIANDEAKKTYIDGYVSPAKNYLDLNIEANHTRLEFVKGFLNTITQNVDAEGTGAIRLFGDLKQLNLTGQVVASGKMDITSLNTTYSMRNDTIRFIPNQIIFSKDTVYDRNGNIGVLDGELDHQYLKDLTFNINIQAQNLLAYDTHTFGENTFYGTVYATGNCGIVGKSGETTITVNATPQKGSQLVYNVGGQGPVDKQNFIKWISKSDSISLNNTSQNESNITAQDNIHPGIPSDLHLNFLINCTPNAAIKLLMDNQTGDFIELHGDGVIRASYYNKGAFDMFGNYVVDHGNYQLTIQNVIKKDFQFQKGGTIAFGGDPFDAALNLKALYMVNGVSLADLNIGKSFTSNNVRVDCLMNITGTPSSPKVDFSLDLPSVNNDAKQMVYSLMNSEEEMNQQVLYLLAVGRFYSQSTNNNGLESSSQRNQANLAMQSILSGTLSQQINNVLSSVVNNSNWNFGANISTGTEGFYNAEYEGLLSGKLLNNRLLIDGQFGYRDKANATTSFIGDFDIKYLLYPNGNLAIRVYNQTNDRYFTRNSLTTQGIGLIIQKDFNGLRDLFGQRRSKKVSK